MNPLHAWIAACWFVVVPLVRQLLQVDLMGLPLMILPNVPVFASIIHVLPFLVCDHSTEDF